jgi:ABC-type nitrate/sulfonate/bicarbonate transport system substrate-binding protein
MSFVSVAPDLLSTAATDLASIGHTLSAARAAAVAPTTRILATAQDEVSTAIAELFSVNGQQFHDLGARSPTALPRSVG